MIEKNKIIDINGISIFYREAGIENKETILLLHGFPSSSYMFKDIIKVLSDEYHVIAPDYPGFGLSAAPSPSDFNYTFDNVTNVIEQFIDVIRLNSFYLLMQDYGGPIGFRIATKRTELIKGLIIQNANAYMEGLGEWAMKIGTFQQANDLDGLNNFKDYLMSIEGLKEQHLTGASNPSNVDPSYYLMDNAFLNRKGAKEIQTVMFFNYGANFSKYQEWQNYFKTHQPRTLIVWGENDKFFSKSGGEAYSKDLKNIQSYYFNGGHFLLDEYYTEVAEKIKKFINK
ncbi:Pimeloyl-ACP methyl ester carboxylesterase [Aquimarina amphilecti]|uniref:Pimeloyl-ACP methyl ester carboxylesterase n=1 Tax=Aquimarina amphilecti TaxID=1038014 RepID=A0A1H7XFH4_AQUAM|nr:alpha/beta hydrolase [Aquimarina amphilecti]SEM31789.1 Pimeloyl-ACP methyl ester carboxylesterase [Aquimarina amphilecti]